MNLPGDTLLSPYIDARRRPAIPHDRPMRPPKGLKPEKKKQFICKMIYAALARASQSHKRPAAPTFGQPAATSFACAFVHLRACLYLRVSPYLV